MDSSPDHHRISTFDLPWLGILLLIVLAIAFLLPVLPNDFWWYLRLGQDIITNGSVPVVDTYSSTVTGQPVTYPMWLSAVWLYAIHHLGGITAIAFTRGLSVAILFALLWLMAVRGGLPGWLATLTTLISAMASANNWAVRPQMFIYPLFGLSLYILFSSKDKTNRLLPWLIPLAWLWANLHGSVILLFLLAGPLFLFHIRSRRVWLFLGLAFLATLINPRGINLWLDSFSIVQATGNQFSQEWKPPTNSGWQMNIFYIWLLAIIPLIAASPRRLKLAQWAWLLGFGWMSLSGTRYVIWFLIVILALTNHLLAGWRFPMLRPQGRRLTALNLAFLAIMVLIPLGLLPGVRQSWWKQSPPNLSGNTPVQATQWLSQHPELPGPIYNDYLFGSYMIYALPERPVWIDSRFYPYPANQWQSYLDINNSAPGWQQTLQNAGVNTLFLNIDEQSRLISQLSPSTGWCQQYSDATAAIFTRCP